MTEQTEQTMDEEIIQIGEHGMLVIAEMFHAVSMMKESVATQKPEQMAAGVSKVLSKYDELHATGMVEDLLDFRRQFYAKRFS